MGWKWEYTVILIMSIYILVTGYGFVFGALYDIIEEYIRENEIIQGIKSWFKKLIGKCKLI